MGSWSGRKTICKRCGISLYPGKAGLHRESLLHRQYKTITSLLTNNAVRDSAVARRLGVSRQRIRQLVIQLGLPPSSERRRAFQNSEQEQRLGIDRLFHTLRARGLRVSLLLTRKKRLSRRRFDINGRLCLLGAVYERRGGYVRLQRCQDDSVDFVFFPLEAYWLVVPAKEMQRGALIRLPQLVWLGPGSRDERRPLRALVNAWHLLEGDHPEHSC